MPEARRPQETVVAGMRAVYGRSGRDALRAAEQGEGGI
jgi:hypothetical protein